MFLFYLAVLRIEPEAFVLSYTPSPFFILRWGLSKLSRLGSNLSSFCLRFQCWDYWHVPHPYTGLC